MPGNGAFEGKHRRIAMICAKRIARRNWRDRRRAIETTIQSLRGDRASFAAGAMVASILDRLGAPTVNDSDQALIFAMSDSPDHQLAACDWFIDQGLKTRDAPAPPPPAEGALDATIH
jgi:hypothetical protein